MNEQTLPHSLDSRFTDRSIGLGTFPFSNIFTEVTQDEAEAIVGEFIDAGGFYIETAPIYPQSQVHLGDILKNFNRDSFLLGTKCALAPGPDKAPTLSGTSKAIESHVQSELSRLGLDYVDLIATHTTPTNVSPSQAAAAMESIREAGLVKHIGVSNVTPDELRNYLEGGQINLIQNRYSVLHRSETEYLLDLCNEQNIFLNPYQIIERGQLLEGTTSRRNNDLRNQKPEYIGDADKHVRNWVKTALAPIAEASNTSLKALVIRWAYGVDRVTLPVIGATNRQQVRDTMKTVQEPLETSVYEQIENAFADLETQVQRLFGVSVPEFRGLD